MDVHDKKDGVITRRQLFAGGASVAVIAGLGFAATPVQASDLGLFTGINRAKDPAHKTGLEMLHVPVFQAPAMAGKGKAAAVQVKIGEKLHPMTMDHWIQRLRVFTDGGMPLADVTFARAGVQPVCEFHFTPVSTTTLIAQIFCNLHGIWEARHTLKV